MKSPAYGTPEWHAERRTGLGGSDIAAVCGLSRFRGPFDVYADKTGQAAPLVDTPALYWGRVLEEVVAREWSKRHGQRIRRRAAMVRHPAESWMYAHLDFDIPGTDGVLEIKTAAHYAADKFGEQGSSEIPGEYLLQVQWELACAGKQTGHVAVLIGGRDYRDYEIARDDEIIGQLMTIGREFWFEHVQKGVPPDLDGSDAAGRYLAQRYPKDTGAEIEADEHLSGLMQDYVRLTAEVGDREQTKRLIGQQLQAAMGEATTLRGPFARATWRFVRGASYTVNRPESRRFVVSEIDE